MDSSTHEEHLSQPLQTNSKQFQIAVTFLTGYNGIFKITISNNKFYFKKTLTNADDFLQITLSPGAHELENLSKEYTRIIIDIGHYSENEHPFTIKPNFSTLGSIIEISPQGPLISFVFIDSIGNLLAFHETKLYEENILSKNPVDILSFDNIFLECDIAKGMIFKGKRSGRIHNFTKDVDFGYKYIGKFRGGLQWYMTETKDVISSSSFKLKNENNKLVSFNGQSISFRISIKVL